MKLGSPASAGFVAASASVVVAANAAAVMKSRLGKSAMEGSPSFE